MDIFCGSIIKVAMDSGNKIIIFNKNKMGLSEKVHINSNSGKLGINVMGDLLDTLKVVIGALNNSGFPLETTFKAEVDHDQQYFANVENWKTSDIGGK